jgi:hypothetical protein
MALRNDEKVGFTAPSPKRRKLGRARFDPQDGVQPTSDGKSKDSVENLSTQKETQPVLVQRDLNVRTSTSTASDLDFASIGAGDISRSSMFKLQVDEMLLAIRPNYTKMVGPVDKALRRLKILIESIEYREPVTVCCLNPVCRCSLIPNVSLGCRSSQIHAKGSQDHNPLS